MHIHETFCPIILIAQNSPDFSMLVKSQLKKWGYRDVVAVDNKKSASEFLANQWANLLVLDVRLDDDNDETDRSGLLIGIDYPDIPKIYLTNHAELATEFYRETRKSGHCVDIIAKSEKDIFKRLKDAINEAFETLIIYNKDLVIHWGDFTDYGIPRRIFGKLDGNFVQSRVGEFEFLVRSLFLDSHSVKFEKLVWVDKEQLGILISTEDHFFNFKNFFLTVKNHVYPQIMSSVRGNVRFLTTTHFETACYLLNDAPEVDQLRTLKSVYQTANIKLAVDGLVNLYASYLPKWSTKARQGEFLTIIDWWKRRLNLLQDINLPSLLKHYADLLQPKQAIAQLICSEQDGVLLFSTPRGNFTVILPTESPVFESKPVMLRPLPGNLRSDTILIDDSANIWLTHFADAGDMEISQPFISLEVEIRYQLSDIRSLREWYEMEKCLTKNLSFELSDILNLNDIPRRAAQVVQTIRKQAQEYGGIAASDYYSVLLLHVVAHLSQINLIDHPTAADILHGYKLLISAALISGQLSRTSGTPDMKLYVNLVQRRVWREKEEISLTPIELQIVIYLAQHQGSWCSREDIYRAVNNQPYTKGSSHDQWINSNIDRIRKKIELNPNQEKYLATKTGRGYMLRDIVVI